MTTTRCALSLLLAVSLAACTSGGSGGTALPFASASPSPTAASGSVKDALSIPVDVITSPDPRPYTVPTTPATDRLEVVTPSQSVSAADDERDAEWKLIRLWDGGSKLAIFSAFGCNEPGRFLVRETQQEVLIRVVYKNTTGRACLSTYRKQIDLNAPLGERRLLHVVR